MGFCRTASRKFPEIFTNSLLILVTLFVGYLNYGTATNALIEARKANVKATSEITLLRSPLLYMTRYRFTPSRSSLLEIAKEYPIPPPGKFTLCRKSYKYKNNVNAKSNTKKNKNNEHIAVFALELNTRPQKMLLPKEKKLVVLV